MCAQLSCPLYHMGGCRLKLAWSTCSTTLRLLTLNVYGTSDLCKLVQTHASLNMIVQVPALLL